MNFVISACFLENHGLSTNFALFVVKKLEEFVKHFCEIKKKVKRKDWNNGYHFMAEVNGRLDFVL